MCDISVKSEPYDLQSGGNESDSDRLNQHSEGQNRYHAMHLTASYRLLLCVAALFIAGCSPEFSADVALGEELKALGKMSGTEIRAIIIFAITVFLWATDGNHLNLFGFQISLVMVAILAALLFYLPYIGVLKPEVYEK